MERANGVPFVLVDDSFETEQGPDLWVVLSPVDTLRAVSGRRTCALRSGLQVDSIGSVAIHCREFGALLDVAPLG